MRFYKHNPPIAARQDIKSKDQWLLSVCIGSSASAATPRIGSHSAT